MSSLSTSLKNSYQKWLHPYEEYLRIFKPGVHQLLEFENGGPFTPSPAPSPMKKSHQHTPSSLGGDSPAIRASTALNATLHHEPPPPLEPQRPAMSSGFTAVNAGGGFTAVNAQPPPHAQPPPPPPAQVSTPSSSFAAINTPNGLHIESRNSTPLRMNGDSPMLSAKNTPDLRPSALGTTPLSNGQAFNHLKRQLSQDTESGANGDSDAGSGRRSKRLKKGKRLRCRLYALLHPSSRQGFAAHALPRSRHSSLSFRTPLDGEPELTYYLQMRHPQWQGLT